jgi:signal transduction histidine kinase
MLLDGPDCAMHATAVSCTKEAGSHTGRGLALACALVPAALALSGLGLSLSRPRFADLVSGHELGDVAMAIGCGLVAALILSRRPGHPVALVFAAIGVAEGLSMLASGLNDVIGPADPGYRWTVWLAAWTWIPASLITVMILPLVFPEGVRGRWRRGLWRTDIALIAAVCLAQALSATLASGPHTTIGNPIGVPGFAAVANVTLVAAVASAAVSLILLIIEVITADERLRRQLLPLAAAAAIVIAVFSTAGYAGTAGVLVQDTAFLLIPGAALLSVLKLRLYEIELAIGRTAGWVLLSGLLIGGYILIVQIASSWLHLYGRVSSILATAVIALAFGPLRALLQRAIARWLYGDRGDPYAALAHTTQVLSGSADPVGALNQAATDLAHRLRSPGVRILRDGIVLAGDAQGRAALAVPLRSGDTEVGRLEILPRTVGESFSRSDERLILDLCAPLTNAVAAVGLSEELSASRERLALAREAERRRVRHELHDDVGPSLAAAAVQARTALRRLQRSDTHGAADSIAALQTTVLNAAADLRSAIDALGPRALDEAGLAEAVHELASVAAEPHVTLEIDELPPLPAAIEVAVYRVIAEALTNARRHAHATSILIAVHCREHQLILKVRDDGTGGARRRPGRVGISSMRARIEELGGSFAIGPGLETTGPSQESGTEISARLPIADAVDELAS